MRGFKARGVWGAISGLSQLQRGVWGAISGPSQLQRGVWGAISGPSRLQMTMIATTMLALLTTGGGSVHAAGGHTHAQLDQQGFPGSANDQRVRSARIQELYETLVAPKALQVITGAHSVDHIFDASVQGRVTPVGEFHDREGVNEYFYGLASTPTGPVVGVAFKSLVASGGKVSVEVDITIERVNRPPPQRFYTLRQTGFFTFDRKNHVISFDLAILNLGAAVNPTTDAERAENITTTCALLTLGFPGQPATCPGTFSNAPNPLDQFAACVAFMQSIPYGTWDRVNSNTAVCRQLHSLLTPLRPDVHCPHCSPGGGGTCIDFTYESFFDKEF